MLGVLGITGTIFVMIAGGYFAVRSGVFDAAGIRVLGGYVVTLALPALIFSALTTNDLRAILDGGYLAAYLAGSLAAFGIVYLWSRRITGFDPRASIFQAMGASCANSGFVGYPILMMTLPGIAGTALALNMIVENLVMIPLVLILAERARSDRPAGSSLGGMILRRLATNPIVLALLAGLAVAALAVDVPAVLARAVDLLARSSAAVSLIVIGGALASVSLGGLRAAVAPVVAGKLLVHPLMVGLALAALPLFGRSPIGDGLFGAAILMAAMPPMGIYPILAQRYGVERVTAVAMLTTTALSFVTVSALLWWLQGRDAL